MLDTNSVIISTSAISICVGLVMMTLSARAGFVHLHWALALVLYGISGLLIGHRDLLPPWLANVVANMLTGLSIVVIHRGAWLLMEKRPPDLLYIISVLILGGIYYQFTYPTPNVGIRIFFVSMFRIPYFMSAALGLRASAKFRHLSGTQTLIWLLIAGSAWYFLRAILAIYSDSWAILLRLGSMQSVNFLIAATVNIMISVALARVEAEVAIAHAAELAAKLKLQSAGLAMTVTERTRELEQEIAEHKIAESELKKERDRLRLSEQKFFRTFDQAPIGASIVSLDGRYIRVNRELERITGYSEAELQRLTVAEITHPDDLPRSDESVRRLLSGDIAMADEIKRYVRKDGEAVWVQVSVRVMRGDDGEPLFFLPMMTDITERRRAERALRVAKEQAEDALEELLATQNNLVHAEKMASLGRLVAGASHEINTPIGVAVTIGSHLCQNSKELAENFRAGHLRRVQMEQFIAEIEEGFDLLLANLHRAADLINSFKHVAADQMSEERHHFDLGECLSESVTVLGPLWRKPGHRIEVICPEPIEVDSYPGVISQILTNFVTNSAVHGFDPGQQGILTISAVLSQAGMVELVYRDNGKGIPVGAHDKVFEPFYTTRRSSGSTGLGMHIVYNLVVGKLGGSIELVSAAGEGVCFTIRFPRAPQPEDQASSASAVSGSAAQEQEAIHHRSPMPGRDKSFPPLPMDGRLKSGGRAEAE